MRAKGLKPLSGKVVFASLTLSPRFFFLIQYVFPIPYNTK